MNYENIKRSNECWIMFIVLMLCHNNGPRIRSHSSAHNLATSWYVQLNFKSYVKFWEFDFEVRYGVDMGVILEGWLGFSMSGWSSEEKSKL